MRYSLCVFIFLVLLLTSCVKDKIEHPFAGTYDCTVTHSYWDMTGANSSSSEQKKIEVLSSEDSIEVVGVKIHEDEIEYGKSFFFGYSYNHMNFRFEKDSIYISTFSGGLGGGSTVSYAGRKID